MPLDGYFAHAHPRRRSAAVVAAVLLLPAAAHGGPLTPLKPCYVTSTDEVSKRDPARADRVQRQRLHAGRARRPRLRRDARSGRSRPTRPATCPPRRSTRPTGARASARSRSPRPTRPTRPTRSRRVSNVTAFDVSISPSTAAPSSRVRFRGRGFTQPGAVYGHYLYRGHVRKTVRLAQAARRAVRDVHGQAPADPGPAAAPRAVDAADRPGEDVPPRAGARGDPGDHPRPARVQAPALTGSPTANVSSPSAVASTRTWSPAAKSPCSRLRASGSTRWRWITRLSGRAP